MGIQRNASARWQGGLKDGNGTISTASGAFKDLPYNFSRRFGDEPGTNPEELVGAAHAACFSMALSGQLEGAGGKPERIDTKSRVSMEKQDAGWTVVNVHLDVTAKVPGMSPEAFAKAAEAAKNGCPISRLLKAEITMDARLA